MSNRTLTDGIDLEEDINGNLMSSLCALGRPFVFREHEYLYRQDDVAGHIFVLVEGSVKATSTHIHGFDTLLKIHGPGSLLGLSALRTNGFRDANGVAITEAKTVSFSRVKFQEILQSNAELGLVLVRVLLKRQQELHARIKNFLGNNVEQRLAESLLQFRAEAIARAGGDEVAEIFITHEDLASLVISRRQYITQILHSFSKRGLIVTGHKRIRILNPDGLRKIIDS